MSIESWLREFYPVPAKDVPREEAAEASLLKWEGLTEENLKKHKIYLKDGGLVTNIFAYGIIPMVFTRQCALCTYYLDEMSPEEEKCHSCPLFQEEGRSCFHPASAYRTARLQGNLEPILSALRSVVRKQKGSKEEVSALKKEIARLRAKNREEDDDRYYVLYRAQDGEVSGTIHETEDEALKRIRELFAMGYAPLNNLIGHTLLQLSGFSLPKSYSLLLRGRAGRLAFDRRPDFS